MIAVPITSHWPGHVAQARRLALGRTDLGRGLGGALAILMLAMTGGFAVAVSGPVPNAFLIGMSALIAGWYAMQATIAAASAQRVMCGSMAPPSGMNAWRAGWLQAQCALLIVFAGADVLVSARQGFQPALWLFPGAVMASQCVGIWTALAGANRASPAWRAGPWLLVGTCIALIWREWDRSVAVSPWIDGLLMAAGASGIFIAWMRLAPLARLGPRSHTGTRRTSALRRYLERWTPLNIKHRKSWWVHWWVSGVTVGYVIWEGPAGAGPFSSFAVPVRLMSVVFMAGLCSSQLTIRELHWRRWLQPGAPLRHRIGSELIRSTLTMYLLVAAPVAATSALVALLSGMPLDALGTRAVRGLIVIPEMIVAVAVAAAFAAVIKGRMDRPATWAILGAVILGYVTLACLAWSEHGSRQSGFSEPIIGAGYIVALLLVAALCVPAGNRLWSRRDLHDLMRRDAKL